MQMNRPDYRGQNQYQLQQQVPQQTDILNEFQYTINQDLQNMLGIAVEFFAIEEIKDQIEPELYKVQKNRLILQHNLSNSIHFDQQETAKARKLQPTLLTMKGAGKDILTKAMQELQSSIPNFKTSEAFKVLEQYEKNNFGSIVSLSQLENEKTNVKGNLDDKVLSQIITAMLQTDLKYEQVRQNKTRLESEDLQTIVRNARTRYEIASKKLSQLNNKTGSKIMVQQNPRANNQNLQSQTKYINELKYLLAAMHYYFETQPENIPVLEDILQKQKNAYMKDPQLYRQQFGELQNQFPSFQDFFSFFKDFYFFNCIGYLPKKQNVSQNEQALLNFHYKEVETNAKIKVIQYLLNIYERTPTQIFLPSQTKLEEKLLLNEIQKLRHNLQSTFMKRALQILLHEGNFALKRCDSVNENADIQFLNQQLGSIDQ